MKFSIYFKSKHQEKDTGKLIIIAGYAPGTGKTHYACSMLSEEKKLGSDVVIGYLNAQRPELKSILKDTENFRPCLSRPITHNEALLDIKMLIKRSPQIVFADELALPNAFDDGHFMYEGIFELIKNGISVYTTVNLQKFKHINSLCAKYTHLKQKTVIPDSVLEKADRLIFLNQSPECIRERYTSGALFTQKQMSRDFLNRYMSLETLKINHEICLNYIKNFQTAEIIEFYQRGRP